MDKKPKISLTKTQALIRLQKYCVYQDRCHSEVRSKLMEVGVYGDDLENVMAELISENFLNEERFARSYARGKFRIKKWGRIRIQQELRRRKISAYCIKKAMVELEDYDYDQQLVDLLEKKNRTLREPDLWKRRGKLANHAVRKGFETGLVWETIKRLWP